MPTPALTATSPGSSQCSQHCHCLLECQTLDAIARGRHYAQERARRLHQLDRDQGLPTRLRARREAPATHRLHREPELHADLRKAPSLRTPPLRVFDRAPLDLDRIPLAPTALLSRQLAAQFQLLSVLHRRLRSGSNASTRSRDCQDGAGRDVTFLRGPCAKNSTAGASSALSAGSVPAVRTKAV